MAAVYPEPLIFTAYKRYEEVNIVDEILILFRTCPPLTRNEFEKAIFFSKGD